MSPKDADFLCVKEIRGPASVSVLVEKDKLGSEDYWLSIKCDPTLTQEEHNRRYLRTVKSALGEEMVSLKTFGLALWASFFLGCGWSFDRFGWYGLLLIVPMYGYMVFEFNAGRKYPEIPALCPNKKK